MLHVTNGDSAVPVVQQAVGADALAWRDTLHDGPVPAAAPEELRRVRARHLAARYGLDEPAILAEMEARDAALLAADAVVVWLEHDLYDQLQLLQLLQILWRRPDARAVVTDGFVTSYRPEELRAMQPGAPDADAAAAAWAAFTGVDPNAWLAVRGDGVLRHVPAAFRRLAEELPWATDGLTRSQRALVGAGGDFAAAQRAEEAPFLGDALAALLPESPSAWLGGVETARWRWDPERGVASPAA
ncbi:MAG TPA: DUF1835 domain-containing protein [Solirubrobacteraceae bacterium]